MKQELQRRKPRMAFRNYRLLSSNRQRENIHSGNTVTYGPVHPQSRRFSGQPRSSNGGSYIPRSRSMGRTIGVILRRSERIGCRSIVDWVRGTSFRYWSGSRSTRAFGTGGYTGAPGGLRVWYAIREVRGFQCNPVGG